MVRQTWFVVKRSTVREQKHAKIKGKVGQSCLPLTAACGAFIRKTETIRDKYSRRNGELEGEMRKDELEDGTAGDRPCGIVDDAAVSKNLKNILNSSHVRDQGGKSAATFASWQKVESKIGGCGMESRTSTQKGIEQRTK